MLVLVAFVLSLLVSPIPDSTSQLVVVTTSDWSATDGSLRRFEREGGGAWLEVGATVPVVVGRSGLGWGIGLHRSSDGAVGGVAGPVKAEGDGRAPAGAFSLSAAFGYADLEATGLPYVPSGPDLRCVDDPASRSYTLVRQMSTDADWQSHERMRRNDGLYRIGVIVAH
ncbi:L,D-transpeptidase family protein, partial [Rubrivirga sp.]|uniref:L,D-transpeptidase family protein n=1 Tax=Rubrivirga sp. TaxID=1885344 RepID=UPI003C7291AB